MKRKIQPFLFALVLCVAALSATAQEETPATAQRNTPRWVSAKGYWVVESNIHDTRHACIYFYANDNTLVHKETIDGVKLPVGRTRTKMKLKKALETVVDAWAAGHPCDSAQNVVAALFTK